MLALATCSGKGGTGKSVCAASVAQELLARGYKVGLIDADFSNPNLAKLLRFTENMTLTPDKKLIPAQRAGLSFFSIEQVVQDRGVGMTAEEYGEIIRDIVQNGEWNVDYLIIDLPAVVSNEFRTALALFEDNFIGTLIVAQPAHLATTERVLKLHQLNGIPVLGIIENMVYFDCEHGTRYYLFGESGSDELAGKYAVNVIGKIPLTMKIQEQIKAGLPVMLPDKETLDNIVKTIITAKPQKLGFLAELKVRIKTMTRNAAIDLAARSTRIINAQLDIKTIQNKYNYLGNQVVALVVMDEQMREVVQRFNYRVKEGSLHMVKEPDNVDIWIYIKGTSLGWSLLGRKKFPDGHTVPYDIMDAWLNSDARVFGMGSITKAISFYRDIWGQATPALRPQLEPIIEALV
jgi:Mrp family chromosome partitioning ATPase